MDEIVSGTERATPPADQPAAPSQPAPGKPGQPEVDRRAPLGRRRRSDRRVLPDRRADRGVTDLRQSSGPPGPDGGGAAGGGGRGGNQAEINARLWSSGRYVGAYDHANLLPAEALILSRYRDAITGRVLDVGCGAGRILGYLAMLGADATGIDISPWMVEHCQRRFPGVDVRVGDLAELAATLPGPFDAVLMPDSVIDVFGDPQRRAVLAGLRELLAPEGLLLFSSHNLDHWDRAPNAGRHGGPSGLVAVASQAARRSPAAWIRMAIDAPAGRRNRRQLRPLQYRRADHAVINDSAHQYGLLHYYIGRLAQERQLSELGFTAIEVLEAHGPSVPPGHEGQSAALYYVATPQR